MRMEAILTAALEQTIKLEAKLIPSMVASSIEDLLKGHCNLDIPDTRLLATADRGAVQRRLASHSSAVLGISKLSKSRLERTDVTTAETNSALYLLLPDDLSLSNVSGRDRLDWFAFPPPQERHKPYLKPTRSVLDTLRHRADFLSLLVGESCVYAAAVGTGLFTVKDPLLYLLLV